MRPLRMAAKHIRWAFNFTSWNPSKNDWVRVAQCIQVEEKERIGKFVFKRDAKSSMIGRLMIRKLIHGVTKIPYRDIRLGRTDKGKPHLLNGLPMTLAGFTFNVSHQGDYVVLASELDLEVGVDVMKADTPRLGTVPDFFRLMQRQFTEQEWRHIKSSGSEAEQMKTFYRLWCLKESYVKALGIGIGFEVHRLNFDLVSPTLDDLVTIATTTLDVDEKATIGWRFEETCIDNHCIAVAIHKQKTGDQNSGETMDAREENMLPTFSTLSFEDLVAEAEPLTEPDSEYGENFMTKQEDAVALKQKNEPQTKPVLIVDS